ncbi:MAG TPA: DUF4489 domain-containing protein [Ruminiclostridium sp.]|nr:DUF4489 domain-containing protein [Ruminiclostridium sp.]
MSNGDTYYSDRARQNVVLSANTGGVGALPVITTLFADPINVVSTTIDTTRLTRSTNLLQFSSVINLPLGVSVTFNFEILRSSDGGSAVKIGPTYTFSTIVDVLESESFSFQFADTMLVPGNYTYSVQLSTNSIIDITPGASIINATLSVLAVEQ